MANGSSGMTAERVFQLKTRLSLAIILVGVIIAIVAVANTTEATQSHASGILIDFEEYNVTWYETDLNLQSDPVKLLQEACSENGYPLTIDSYGKVLEINGIENDGTSEWGLWYVPNGGFTDWVKSDTYDITAKDYAVVAWAFREPGEVPTVGVDSTGVCFYGYSQAYRIVTISPVATETVAAMGAGNIIVGADYYSNYPESIVTGKARGEIAVTGTYTDPNYEIIMNQKPDIVIGDGSQFNQIQLCKTIRSSTNSVVLYNGEDMKTIMDNSYIAANAILYNQAFDMVKENIEDALDGIDHALGTVPHEDKRVMVALSTDISPYVAGTETYIDDMLGTIYVTNAFESIDGWSHINMEWIPKYNPEIIIVVSEKFENTQEDWDAMYTSLYDNWKNTDAYRSGEIYLLTEDATDLASRSSPRFPRMVELLGEICYPEAFGLDGMSKYLGHNYYDYINYSEYIGYI